MRIERIVAADRTDDRQDTLTVTCFIMAVAGRNKEKGRVEEEAEEREEEMKQEQARRKKRRGAERGEKKRRREGGVSR
ncbi:hypothetical protein ACLOJK_024502 [Asimina triloba]